MSRGQAKESSAVTYFQTAPLTEATVTFNIVKTLMKARVDAEGDGAGEASAPVKRKKRAPRKAKSNSDGAVLPAYSGGPTSTKAAND